jgi:hypothetical protein
LHFCSIKHFLTIWITQFVKNYFVEILKDDQKISGKLLCPKLPWFDTDGVICEHRLGGSGSEGGLKNGLRGG